MSRVTSALGLSLVLVFGSSQLAAQEAREPSYPLESDQRFTGEVTYSVADGDRRARVEVVNWTIIGGAAVRDFPLRDGAQSVIHVRAGGLVTVIDGERRERREGEYWTVPPDTRMEVILEDDAAVLQIVSVSSP